MVDTYTRLQEITVNVTHKLVSSLTPFTITLDSSKVNGLPISFQVQAGVNDFTVSHTSPSMLFKLEGVQFDRLITPAELIHLLDKAENIRRNHDS